MKANEMSTIESDYRPVLGNGKRQDLLIGPSLTTLSRLLRRQDVVSKTSQLQYRRITEVLVGIQSGHRLGILVIPDGAIDLFRILVVVVPSSIKIRLSEIGVVLQNLLIRQALLTPLHQPSDRVPRASNARFSTADPACFVDLACRLRLTMRHCRFLCGEVVSGTLSIFARIPAGGKVRSQRCECSTPPSSEAINIEPQVILQGDTA
jgi:hypothetical protein